MKHKMQNKDCKDTYYPEACVVDCFDEICYQKEQILCMCACDVVNVFKMKGKNEPDLSLKYKFIFTKKGTEAHACFEF